MSASATASPADAPPLPPAREDGAAPPRGVWSEQLRPRAPYEAIDFGFQFVREHYLTLLGLAALLVLPGAIPPILLFPEHPFWVSFYIWWTKPFWERPLLYYLSRALLGHAPTVRETLAALPAYGSRGLIAALTIHRLAPMRSFDMPVSVLEGSTGAVRATRLSVLRRGRHAATGSALTIVLLHVEWIVQLGLLGILGLFLPEALVEAFSGALFGSEEQFSTVVSILTYAAYVLAILAVAPFYVAGGFSLYLHRRTELEAWDLELAFRRIAARAAARRRLAGVASSASLALVAATALALGGSALPAPAFAITAEKARESIDTILDGEDFHRVETISVPRFVLDWNLTDSEVEAPPGGLASFLSRVGRFVGAFGQVLLVAIALGALAWLLVRVLGDDPIRRALPAGRPRRQPAPRELFGLEITEESLPEDVAGDALSAARAGRARESLALLYRGALTKIALVHGADLSRGGTERECLEVARPVLDGEAIAYFTALTQSWLRCAYGHRPPPAEELQGLCAEWSRRFGSADEPGPAESAT